MYFDTMNVVVLLLPAHRASHCKVGFGNTEKICNERYCKNSYDINIYRDVNYGCDISIIQAAKQFKCAEASNFVKKNKEAQ